VKRIERTSVTGHGELDASVRTGEARGFEKLADGETVRGGRRKSQIL